MIQHRDHLLQALNTIRSLDPEDYEGLRFSENTDGLFSSPIESDGFIALSFSPAKRRYMKRMDNPATSFRRYKIDNMEEAESLCLDLHMFMGPEERLTESKPLWATMQRKVKPTGVLLPQKVHRKYSRNFTLFNATAAGQSDYTEYAYFSKWAVPKSQLRGKKNELNRMNHRWAWRPWYVNSLRLKRIARYVKEHEEDFESLQGFFGLEQAGITSHVDFACRFYQFHRKSGVRSDLIRNLGNYRGSHKYLGFLKTELLFDFLYRPKKFVWFITKNRVEGTYFRPFDQRDLDFYHAEAEDNPAHLQYVSFGTAYVYDVDKAIAEDGKLSEEDSAMFTQFMDKQAKTA